MPAAHRPGAQDTAVLCVELSMPGARLPAFMCRVKRRK